MIDFLENLESKLQRQENAALEAAIRNETLDSEIQCYLEEYNVSEEQLSHFISKKENFTDQNWQDLQNAKKEIEAKLQLELNTITNPLRLKKAYKERNVAQHWLFVR